MTSSRAVCGYRRLSVDRTGMKIGYEVQTDGGKRWSTLTGIPIAHWYEDRNESAADEEIHREGYEQMLRDIEAGMWGGLVVWRVDRLTRLDDEFLRVWGVVRRAGGHIYSTDESISTETDGGLTQMKLKVLLGDSEVRTGKRRLRANVNTRLKKGLYMGGGRRPYGFEGPVHDSFGRVTNTGQVGVAHVESEIKILQDAARRIAWEGESYLDVINDWNDQVPPIVGVTGARWAIQTLTTVLTSLRMVGEQYYIDDVTGEKAVAKAVWEPVLDERTFKKLCSMKKKADKKYSARETYVLTNEIMCGRCKMPLKGSQRTYPRNGGLEAVRTYRCPSGVSYKAAGHCGALNVLAGEVEKLVLAHVFVRLAETKAFMTSMAGVDDPALNLLDALEAKVEEVSEQLKEIEEVYVARRIKLAEYLRMRDPLQAELDGYDEKMRSISARLDIPQPVGSDWNDLPRWFEGLSFRQQKVVVQSNIAYAEVLPPGRSGRYFRKDRVVVVPQDIPLADLEEADVLGE